MPEGSRRSETMAPRVLRSADVASRGAKAQSRFSARVRVQGLENRLVQPAENAAA